MQLAASRRRRPPYPECEEPSRGAIGPKTNTAAGVETWHRIQNAIERFQARAPAEGEGALGRNGHRVVGFTIQRRVASA
jgi:hypothetical protein